MKKAITLWKTGIFLLIFLLPIGVQAFPITGLYNTGVDDRGAILPFGAIDRHYSLSGMAAEAYAISPNPFWVPAPVGSRWIGPSGGSTTDSLGDFIYTLTFSLSGFDLSSVNISGDWAYDNLGVLTLNGLETVFSNPTQFFSLSNFNLNSGFLAGLNTLEFKVTNLSTIGINPTGLLVTNLKGDASLIDPVPEPSTLFLLGSGLAGIVLYSRKRKNY